MERRRFTRAPGREVGRGGGPGRPAVPATATHRGEEVLAVGSERRGAAAIRVEPADHVWKRFVASICAFNAWADFSAIDCQTRRAHLEHEGAKAELIEVGPGRRQGGARVRD
jgi:hypothetical protein